MTEFTLENTKKAEYKKLYEMDCGDIFKSQEDYYMLTDELDNHGNVLVVSLDAMNLGVIHHFDPDNSYETFDSELILKVRG